MVSLSFNGRETALASGAALSAAWERGEREPGLELWLSIEGGALLCMLRNGAHAWLMYLREEGDSGLHSLGDPAREGTARYTLSNGQVDEYPLAWCIGLARCREAFMYFREHGGARLETGTGWQTEARAKAPAQCHKASLKPGGDCHLVSACCIP
jgi:hypothetical protein